MGEALPPVRKTFRAVARTVVPEAGKLDASGWEELEAVVETALADQRAGMRRQLVLFVVLIDLLALLRFWHRFDSLASEQRLRLLRWLQDAPVLRVRRGLWGLRTLVLMGYYGRPSAAAAIGWRPDPRGWAARR